MVESTSPSYPPASQPGGFPPGTMLDQMYNSMNEWKEVGDLYLRAAVNQPVERIRNQLQEAIAEQKLALDNTIHQDDVFAKWSNASLIGTACSAIVSIVSGSTLFYNGKPKEGIQFISIGVVALMQALMTENRWKVLTETVSFGNETVQKNLQTFLPIGVALATYVWAGTNIFYLDIEADKKMQMISTIVQFYGVVTKMGEIWSKYKSTTAEIQKQEADNKVFYLEGQLKTQLNRQIAIADSHEAARKNMRSVIKKQTNARADAAHSY
jgi:hypothetical protein